MSALREVNDNRISIALIKPDAVPGLYHSGYGDETSFVQRAAAHWGPVGLFHRDYFSTDYHIIYIDHENPTTSQWAEPSIDCVHDSIRNLSRPLHIPRRPEEGYSVQGISRSSYVNITTIAVHPRNISWHKYDIVLSYSPAVSEDVILKYPSTIWAYWIVEGCQRSYIQSRKGHLIRGWDLFLTQDFNLAPNLPENVVEFPLTFEYHGGLADLLQADFTNKTVHPSQNHILSSQTTSVRSGILLLPSHFTGNERHLLENIEYFDIRHNQSKKMSLTILHGTTPYSMNLQLRKKYAVVWNRTARGNALGEAWSSGLLVLGHVHDRVINQEILRLSACEFSTMELLVRKIIELEQDEASYKNYLLRQKKLFDALAFYGPLRELIDKGLEIVERRIQKIYLRKKIRNARLLKKPANIFTSWRTQIDKLGINLPKA